jgi:hypothetical protein
MLNHLDVGMGQDELSDGAVIGESVHSVADGEDKHARGRIQAVSLHIDLSVFGSCARKEN